MHFWSKIPVGPYICVENTNNPHQPLLFLCLPPKESKINKRISLKYCNFIENLK